MPDVRYTAQGVHIYIYIYTYSYIYIYIYIYIFIHMYLFICLFTYIFTHTFCTLPYSCIHTYVSIYVGDRLRRILTASPPSRILCVGLVECRDSGPKSMKQCTALYLELQCLFGHFPKNGGGGGRYPFFTPNRIESPLRGPKKG